MTGMAQAPAVARQNKFSEEQRGHAEALLMELGGKPLHYTLTAQVSEKTLGQISPDEQATAAALATAFSNARSLCGHFVHGRNRGEVWGRTVAALDESLAEIGALRERVSVFDGVIGKLTEVSNGFAALGLVADHSRVDWRGAYEAAESNIDDCVTLITTTHEALAQRVIEGPR